MREFLEEGDVVVSEIKSVSFADKSIGLHIRHEKFGKQGKGIVVSVSTCLLHRMKTQFYERGNIKMVFGLNGIIWLSPSSEEITVSVLGDLAKMRAIIILLDRIMVTITPEFLFEIMATTFEYTAKDLLLPTNYKNLELLIKNLLADRKKSQPKS